METEKRKRSWAERFELSTRAAHVLEQSDCKHPADVIAKGAEYWLRTPNCGRHTFNELQAVFGYIPPVKQKNEPYRSLRHLDTMAMIRELLHRGLRVTIERVTPERQPQDEN